ncbi:polysaccharide biosynthesis tyrosine autokinase [Anaeromyxobacter diazotrophicus]|uniref:Tyrosine kinase BceF n=1 Tax=Anaeromyxobacter diazotrophicus TaxID=2590199 RepID=A0A7I9VJ95_9BACT|nr:polysaccharide biosynthesis tyrosine autokinase [Anaeromyxobacter diazotrophicus]GEJ56259.1 tyrosine kinase BceF [Anaeromyxobacter diazotrophicus]
MASENEAVGVVRGGRALAAPRGTRREEPSLGELLQALIDGKGWVLGALALALAAAGAYLFLAPPLYRSSALVQVDDEPAPLSEADRADHVAALLLEQKLPIEGEMEIMRSRSLAGPVVDALGLTVVAAPRRVPLLGDALARRRAAEPPAAPPLAALGRFGWGGERIAVARLEVSDDLLDEPIWLTALGEGRYRLAGRDGAPWAVGSVGAPVTSTAAGHRVELSVAELVARPGTEFRLERRRRDTVIDELQRELRIEEKVKKSGVVAVELEGRDPARVAAIVGALSSAYVAQNVERKTAAAGRTLAFLEAQLPLVKASLDAAEGALSAYRSRKATVDLPIEAKATVDRFAELDKQVAQLAAEREQLAQKYGPQHPDLVALDRKLEAARRERASFEPQVRAAPATQMDASRLTREVNAKADIYLSLLNKAQALRVLKSGNLGNVRLVDAPVVAHKPFTPKPVPVLALAALVGLALGCGLAIAVRVLHEELVDPQLIEGALGLPILAAVPHSEEEARLERRGRRGRAALAAAAPDDLATENLRALRTALGFLLNARGNVVALSSPSPTVGKSFVAVNLAHLFAAAGKRVLLVDADLRRGGLQRFFSAGAHAGLADVLAGRTLAAEAIQSTGTANLDLLSAGHLPEHPAELLASPRLHEVLRAAATRYDVVVVDAPPILAVTDPVLVARCADVNLLVLRSGRDPLSEIALALERYAQSGVTVHGAIMNAARPAHGYRGAYEHRSYRRPRVKLAG